MALIADFVYDAVLFSQHHRWKPIFIPKKKKKSDAHLSSVIYLEEKSFFLHEKAI